MMISTRGRYALRVMLDLAECPADEYVPLVEICNRQGISEKYLEGIISSLSKEKYVAGVRGKGGGYKLTKKPEEYSVWSVLKLTEKSMAPVSCLENGHEMCDRADMCKTLPMWKKLDSIVEDYLDSVSIADLLNNNVK